MSSFGFGGCVLWTPNGHIKIPDSFSFPFVSLNTYDVFFSSPFFEGLTCALLFLFVEELWLCITIQQLPRHWNVKSKWQWPRKTIHVWPITIFVPLLYTACWWDNLCAFYPLGHVYVFFWVFSMNVLNIPIRVKKFETLSSDQNFSRLKLRTYLFWKTRFLTKVCV